MAARVLDLLEAFSQRRSPLLLTEIARAIGAPNSSCSELVQTLKRRGYLYALGRRRGFYPTRRWLVHARVIAANDPALRQLDEMLARLRDRTGETVIVGKLQDEAVVYLDVLEGLHSIRYSALAGDQKPLHSSAIGKAFLGSLTREERARRLGTGRLAAITPATIVDPAVLAADLERGRRRGYFVTRGENVEDVMALARIVLLGGEPLGVAVAGPIHRMGGREEDTASALLGACQALELAA